MDATDAQQFAALKDQLGLPQEAADRLLAQATRSALQDQAGTMIRPPAGQKRGEVTAEQARRFRGQVQSLGMDLQKDTAFNEKVVTLLYALEVQWAVENDATSELAEVQEAYGIPAERAAAIVEATAERYISQLLNLALRAAKKYDEREAVAWATKVASYVGFVSGSVLADGNLFSEDDKERLVQFYEGSLRMALSDSDSGASASGSAGSSTGLAAAHPEVAEQSQRLRELIKLSDDFVPPVEGIDGLLGKVQNVGSVSQSGDNKRWAWG